MAYAYQYGEPSIGVGAILTETVARLRESGKAVAIYVAAFALAGVLADVLGGQAAPGYKSASQGLGMAFGVANIVGSYLVIEAMLRDSGQHGGGNGRRYLGYFGQAILIALGVGMGLILLMVPGIIFACRWVLAPSLLIGREQRAIEAMRNSWELTRGHALAIFLAALAVLLPMLMVAGLAAIAAEALGRDGTFALVIVNLSSYLFSALTFAFGVAILRLLDPSDSRMVEVFA